MLQMNTCITPRQGVSVYAFAGEFAWTGKGHFLSFFSHIFT